MIENQLRREAEKCDRLESVMISADLSGGTGSSLLQHVSSLFISWISKI